MEIYELWQRDKIPYDVNGDRIPRITYYPAENKKTTATVLIIPGGGYRSVSEPSEGKDYALYFNSLGYDAFTLYYRVNPILFPAALVDSRRAMRYIRYNADKFGIDKDRILVMGSSAGGHLAALTSTYKGDFESESLDEIDEMDCMPNGQILCYPVLDAEGHIHSYRNLLGDSLDELKDKVTPYMLADENTSPVFAWHTEEDATVNVVNTYTYAIRLKELGVPCEIHTFPFGPHALNLSHENEHVAVWTTLLERWLKLMNFTD